MYTAGVDMGAITAKAAILGDEGLLATALILAGYDRTDAALQVLNQALAQAGLSRDQIACLVATGYGRVQVAGSDRTVTEITCHARGAHYLCPNVHTVIDIGGQDSKGIAVGTGGKVLDFVMNDKCAAGTGRFLEVMAAALEVDLDEGDPFVSMARAYTGVFINVDLPTRLHIIADLAQRFEVDGVVMHANRSCKPFSLTQSDIRDELRGELGLPILLVEADMCDSRLYNERAIRERVAAFLEMLQ